jgi:hypothetical protein
MYPHLITTLIKSVQHLSINPIKGVHRRHAAKKYRQLTQQSPIAIIIAY